MLLKEQMKPTILKYLNKRFNVFMFHSRIPDCFKSSGRTVKQIILGKYMNTWDCLFWWSTGNIQNSIGLYYAFRKYVVLLTMLQFTSK